MLELVYVIKKIKKNPLIFVRSILLLSFIMLFLSTFLINLFLPGINQRKFISNSNFKQINFYDQKKVGSILYTEATAYSDKIQLEGGRKYYNNDIDIQLFIASDQVNLANSYYNSYNIVKDESNHKSVSVLLSYNCIRELGLKIGDNFTIEYNTSKEPYHAYYDAKLTGVLRPKYGDDMQPYQGICFVICDNNFLKSLDEEGVKYQHAIFLNESSDDNSPISSISKSELINKSYSYSDISGSRVIIKVIPPICVLLLFLIIFRETKHINKILHSDINVLRTLGLNSRRCNLICLIAASVVITFASIISLLLLGVLTNYLLKMYLDIFIVVTIFMTEIICIFILLLINGIRTYKIKEGKTYEFNFYSGS